MWGEALGPWGAPNRGPKKLRMEAIPVKQRGSKRGKFIQVNPRNTSEFKWIQIIPKDSKQIQLIPSELKWPQMNTQSDTKWAQGYVSESKCVQVSNPSDPRRVQVNTRNPSKSKCVRVSVGELKWINTGIYQVSLSRPIQLQLAWSVS